MSGRAGRVSSPGGPGKISSPESPSKPDHPERSGRQVDKAIKTSQEGHAG